MTPSNAPTAQGQPIKVLVVEDEHKMRRFITTLLQSQGYKVVEATTGQEAISAAAIELPEIILLDLGLPDLSGLEVLKQLRQWSQTPVIVLSARGMEQDKVGALDLGADDYLSKPFGNAELLARLRVAARHVSQRTHEPELIVEIDELKIDLAQRLVTLADEPVALTATEYKLLHFLARHPGKLLTHREILKEVWGPGATSEQNHYVRVYMAHLRKKIERDPAQPRYLITEAGLGYRLLAE